MESGAGSIEWDVELTSTKSGVGGDVPIAVFQCIGCRSILGDSTAMVYSCTPTDKQRDNNNKEGTEEHDGWIALAATAPHAVRRDEALTASNDPWDIGCLYYSLSCAHCGRAVGKMYHSTPRVLDPLRDQYCLNWADISSYCVGSGVSEDRSIAKGFPTYDELWSRINQITETLLRQTERIEGIEDFLGQMNQKSASDNKNEL